MRQAFWISAISILFVVSSSVAQNPNGFTRIPFTLERKLRHKTAAVRIEGLVALQKYPQAKAVTLCLRRALDPDRSVRHAVLDTLLVLQRDAKVRPRIGKLIFQNLNDSNAILVLALLADPSYDKEIQAALNKLFKNPVPLIPVVLASEDLGSWPDTISAIRALDRMADLDAFARAKGIQRRVITGLTSIRQPQAVASLVKLMDKTEGEVLWDLTDYLRKVTQQDVGPKPLAWQAWWADNGDDFRFPGNGSMADPGGGQAGNVLTYYNIPVRSKRLVFILDISGSMAGPRIISAKRELITVIWKLPADTIFNIVVYNVKVGMWSPRPVRASKQAKQLATAYITKLTVGKNTHTYDALTASLKLNSESIYILTDGNPTGGTIVDVGRIVIAIRRLNALQGTSIHTIGIAPGPDTSVFSRFLKVLAAQNHGQYQKVN